MVSSRSCRNLLRTFLLHLYLMMCTTGRWYYTQGIGNAAKLTEVVPQNHCLPIMHQVSVLGMNTAVNSFDSETGLLYTAITSIGTSHFLVLDRKKSDAVGNCLLWARSPGWRIPPTTVHDSRALFTSQKPLWFPLNMHVSTKVPLCPIKLFRHGFQVFFYPKTKWESMA